MALLAYDINLDQDADWNAVVWTVYAADRVTVIPLTGCTARMMIKSLPADTVGIVSITDTLTSQGQLLINGSAGTVTPSISRLATALLVAQSKNALTSKYIYDVFVDFPTGKSTALVSGNVNVRLAITHT